MFTISLYHYFYYKLLLMTISPLKKTYLSAALPRLINIAASLAFYIFKQRNVVHLLAGTCVKGKCVKGT